MNTRVIAAILSIGAIAPNLVLAQSTNPEFIAGVVNVKTVVQKSDGSGEATVQVRQVLRGGNTKSIAPSGASVIGGSFEDPFINESNDVLELTQEVHTNIAYNGKGGYSKASLTPSTEQDQSFGCRSMNFSVTDRIKTLENRSLSNADFSVSTGFFIVDNRFSATSSTLPRPVFQQAIAAPNYEGPLMYQFPLDQKGEVDLKPFIKADTGYTCGLVTQKNQHGLAGTGLQDNPSIAGHAVSVSTDCVLRVNTTGANVGSKYGLRVQIKSTYADPKCGAPLTNLDLLLQVGCGAGDLSCLGCGAIDTTAIVAGSQRVSDELNALTVKFIKSNTNLRIKIARLQKDTQNRTLLRRALKKASDDASKRKALIDATLFALGPSIETCSRPSPFFCTTLDIAPSVQPVIQVLNQVRQSTKKLIRQNARLLQVSRGPDFKLRSKRGGRPIKKTALDEVNRKADEGINILAPLNTVVSQCQ